MGRYFWTSSFWMPFTLYHTSHFLFPYRRLDLLATTLSSSPENSTSISVFYKKVEAPVLLVVGDQEGAFFIQWQEKGKNRQRSNLSFFFFPPPLHPIDPIVTLPNSETTVFNGNGFKIIQQQLTLIIYPHAMLSPFFYSFHQPYKKGIFKDFIYLTEKRERRE